MSNPAYPVDISINYPERQSRIFAFFNLFGFMARIIMLIPHFVILYVIQLIALVAAWINQFMILFTGKSSPSMHKFIVGAMRWSARMNAYMLGLTDKYPPFRMEE